MKRFALAFAAASLIASPAFAALCRDAKGKFIKCPTAVAKPMTPKRCKDAKGKFTKCGTPGAKPA